MDENTLFWILCVWFLLIVSQTNTTILVAWPNTSQQDSDEELPSAHQARDKASARSTGNISKHQESSSGSRSSEDLRVTSNENNKNSSEIKEGQRSRYDRYYWHFAKV